MSTEFVYNNTAVTATSTSLSDYYIAIYMEYNNAGDAKLYIVN